MAAVSTSTFLLSSSSSILLVNAISCGGTVLCRCLRVCMFFSSCVQFHWGCGDGRTAAVGLHLFYVPWAKLFTIIPPHGLRPIAAWSWFLYIWLTLLIGGGEDLATCCCCLLKPVGVCCCRLLNYHTVFICLPINSFTTVYPFLLDILPFQQGCGSRSALIRNHIPSWIRIKEGQI